MSDDLAERLRASTNYDDRSDAADLIEAQAARIAELETALKPLSCSCTGFCGVMGWLPANNKSCVRRQARAALEGGKKDE